MNKTEFKKHIQRFLLYPILGKIYLQWFFRPLYIFSSKGLHIGGGSVFQTSGELWVLKFLRSKYKRRSLGRPVVLFDVGANKGEYSEAVMKIFDGISGGYQLYTFEPSISIFKELSILDGKNASLHLVNMGLSSQTKKQILYVNNEHSVTSSLHKGNLKNFGLSVDIQEEVSLITLDDFCSQNGISYIDFLKLDVEGHELEIFKGAKSDTTGRPVA